jgi:tetratricopeptide (TPR) repeat protein
MRNNRALFWIVFVLATAGGCAGLGKKSSEKMVKVKHEKLLQTYLEKGQNYEQNGELVRASKQYELALAVSPDNQVAIERSNRLETRLRAIAQRHYRSGLKLHNRGKSALARLQFLTALRFWPDHTQAKEMLAVRGHIRAERYVTHEIQPGENLSKLAKVYYGDYHKFGVIAQYNNLADATRVKVGQEIKVPEIDGLPFLARKQDIEIKEKKVPAFVPSVEEAEDMNTPEDVSEEQTEEGTEEETEEETEEGAEEETEEVTEEEPEPVVDVVAMYRDQGIDLFNQKEYQEAIFELTKVVNVDPEDRTAIEYLYKSHFQRAMILFEKENYLAARKEFEASLEYRHDCRKCHEYAKKCEEMYYKATHYNRGVSYFGKEQLSEAVKEWELVQAVDPGYKQVEDYISKAKALLKRLEEIKKAQEQR